MAEEEVDKKSSTIFKSVLEYFTKKSTADFLSQYKNLFENIIDDNTQKTEFSSLLEAYHNSSPKAAIRITFGDDIKKISSKNRYMKQALAQLEELKKNSAPIIHNLNNSPKDDFLYVDNIVESAELIKLVNNTTNAGPNNNVKIDFKKLMETLRLMNNDLIMLKNALPLTKKFKYKEANYDGIKESFKDYIIRAEDMITEPDYLESPIKKLEDIIEDPGKCFSRGHVDRFILKTENQIERVEFKRTFIALVAPSLCGKTQSAFAMRNVRPLYFALNEYAEREGKGTQPIYANFDSLNQMIEEVGTADIKTIKDQDKFKYIFRSVEIEESKILTDEKLKYAEVEHPTMEDISTTLIENLPKEQMSRVYADLTSIYASISASNLLNVFNEQKFFTLGFLVALMEEAEALYEDDRESELIPGSKMSWMEFHSKRGDRDDLYFSAISISEALKKSHLFTKYFLFLDEFSGFPWAVLVRNLARSIGMRVLVANTNSDIANLTGKSHVSSSRESGKSEVWSIVVVRLNKSCRKESDQNHKLLIEKIDEIVLSCENTEKDAIKLFFESFINEQFFLLRPGVLDFVREIILNFSVKRNEPAHYILDTIIRDLGSELERRKSKLKSTPHGRLANLGLFLKNAYYDKNADNDEKIEEDSEEDQGKVFHRSSYLMNHLYYLENPVDNGDFIFLTFYPDENIDHLQIYSHDTGLRAWIADYTYFDIEEFLTVLGCMTILSPQSVIDDVTEGKLISASGNIDIGNSPNPEAIKLEGNRLEVLAAVCIIEASQHNYQDEYSTLIGQNCFNFARSIAVNLCRNVRGGIYKNRRKNDVRVFYSSVTASGQRSAFNLETFLSSITVPFLYSANCTVPKILAKLTELEVINVGSCHRTPDREKIDFKFEIIMHATAGNSLIETGERYFCMTECKNWCNPITSLDLIDIIQNAYNIKSCCLNLIFCNSLKDFTLTDFKNLWGASRRGKLNIFKIEKHPEKLRTFNWIPIVGDHTDPEMIVLIYELNVFY